MPYLSIQAVRLGVHNADSALWPSYLSGAGELVTSLAGPKMAPYLDFSGAPDLDLFSSLRAHQFCG